jgi:glycosyltransferase involved in cell wall biosynthesis
MASGMACVVTDYGGPGNVVTQECGIKIPLGTGEELIDRFRDKLERLAVDSELRNHLGKVARERIRRFFTWDVKARMFLEVYHWVLGHRRDKPDLESVADQEQ